MNKFAAALVSTAAVTILTALAGIAHAEPKAPKAPKPFVCSEWDVVTVKGKDALLCTSTKRPTVMLEWKDVELYIPNGDGSTVHLAIGFAAR